MFIRLLHDFSRNPRRHFSKPYGPEEHRLGNTARTIFFNITSHPRFGFSRGLLVSASTFLTEFDAVPIFFMRAVCLSYPRLRDQLYTQYKKRKKIKPLHCPIFFFPLGKKNYLQVFVGHLLGSSLLKLTHQARLMRVCGEKRVGALRPRSSVC
jgi:hypothetical protein